MSNNLSINSEQIYDVIGIGAGPFNLSAAALMHEFTDLKSLFLEKKEEHENWYENMLIPGAKMQTSFLKDLVSCVAPNSVFSFLMYIKSQKRLYQLIHSDFDYLPRHEFASYLKWVSTQLPTIKYRCEVQEVKFNNGIFSVQTSQGLVHSKHLIVGTGRVPEVPDFARPFLGKTVYKGIDYLHGNALVDAKTVVIVGGGQTGAEIFLDIAQRNDLQHISKIVWLSRRDNFYPLDASPFVNELFVPSYVRYFYSLNEQTRGQKLEQQKYASDGISPETLQEIYQLLYQQSHFQNGSQRFLLMPGRELCGMLRDQNDRWRLSIRHLDSGLEEIISTDVTILSTGLETKLPGCIQPLLEQCGVSDNEWRVRPDFSVDSDHLSKNRIYLQNFARDSHGIADPNLSLASWRSGTIINSILGKVLFEADDIDGFVQWAPLIENNPIRITASTIPMSKEYASL